MDKQLRVVPAEPLSAVPYQSFSLLIATYQFNLIPPPTHNSLILGGTSGI